MAGHSMLASMLAGCEGLGIRHLPRSRKKFGVREVLGSEQRTSKTGYEKPLIGPLTPLCILNPELRGRSDLTWPDDLQLSKGHGMSEIVYQIMPWTEANKTG